MLLVCLYFYNLILWQTILNASFVNIVCYYENSRMQSTFNNLIFVLLYGRYRHSHNPTAPRHSHCESTIFLYSRRVTNYPTFVIIIVDYYCGHLKKWNENETCHWFKTVVNLPLYTVLYEHSLMFSTYEYLHILVQYVYIVQHNRSSIYSFYNIGKYLQE